MVVFDEDPVTLIRQTTANFHTASDLSSIARISSSLSTLRSARSLRLASQSGALSQLSRRLHHTSAAHEADLHRHDAAQHATEILALDTEKFRVAKAASELEIEGERLGGELRGLRGVLARLEEGGDEGGAGEAARTPAQRRAEDEIVLKLRVYRSLGIDAEMDPRTGEFGRAVVRNTRTGDVRVVQMDAKFDRFFYANHFWGTL
ncbi:hypothetical protein MBLNU459_g7693t1 [Dothideomycetes sp. NU459]